MRRWKPGDVVDEKEVDRIVLELLPTTYRDDLRQAGEAFLVSFAGFFQGGRTPGSYIVRLSK